MTRRPTVRILAVGAVLAILWGCGGTAASIQPAAASTPSASAAEPSASAAGPSAEQSAAASPAGGPSFVLPSDAKDLEALLPDTICGAKAQKASVSGSKLGSSGGAEFIAGLNALGKSPSDVSFAFAFASSGCGAGIFRVAGVDQNALQSAMLDAVQKSGQTYTQSSLGGKTVYVSTDASGSGKQYVYFHGDAVLFASAPDEAKAATILQALP